MIVNGQTLLAAKPLKPMCPAKMRSHGVSYGLSEAGYDIRIKQRVVLTPFRSFKLASSLEYFSMPPDLLAIVHDKSTWARRGLSVFNTVIEPGWRGWLTLELIYHGWKPLIVPEGAGIAQVIFHSLVEKSVYSGKYNDQPNEPVGAIFERK